MRPSLAIAAVLAVPALLLLAVALLLVAPSAAIAWWAMRRAS